MTNQYVKIPVRIILQVGDGPTCMFTIDINFTSMVSIGQKIIFEYIEQLGTIVNDIYHFISNDKNSIPACLVVTKPITLSNNDDMFRLLDWFKAGFIISDFNSDRSNPDTYYTFYRTVVSILGVNHDQHPRILYDQTNIKIFAELCRAIMIAELDFTDSELPIAAVEYNEIVKILHRVILDRKKSDPDGADMLLVVKEWEKIVNQNNVMKWSASIEKCVDVARFLFKKLPSIPSGRLPPLIRD